MVLSLVNIEVKGHGDGLTCCWYASMIEDRLRQVPNMPSSPTQTGTTRLASSLDRLLPCGNVDLDHEAPRQRARPLAEEADDGTARKSFFERPGHEVSSDKHGTPIPRDAVPFGPLSLPSA